MVKVGPVTDEQFRKVDLSTSKPNRSDIVDNKLEILAGPILRYWGSKDDINSDGQIKHRNAIWRGSITYVTRDSESNYNDFPPMIIAGKQFQKSPYLYAAADGVSFWRYDLDLPTHPVESLPVTYQLGVEHREYTFWIPGQAQTMRTMFYSCNGFSLSVDTKQFPGCMWDDVLRQHKSKSKTGSPNPFHVMLGGGDQSYCDSINLVLPENALKSRDPLKEDRKMRDLVNKFYSHQYVDWYGRGYWKGTAGETYQQGWIETLAQIPSLNIFDDHDIIDGFGTYRDSTMSSPIFKIIGEYAYLYYMSFQQNVNITNDPKSDDPSWITTNRPGPYINQPARSIFARLGRKAAFSGLDCRTERKKNQVCRKDHYASVYDRIRKEVTSDPEIKHIYTMSGVPIAYPRMVWAEVLMSSRLIEPVKWLSKKGIILKGLVNPFDGDVELSDDLNDHWTAKDHKHERNHFLKNLMHIQRDLSIRITILAGDVHSCAVGAFASIKPTPPEQDANFIVCPVSSAIVNTPPPPMSADFMNRRNRTHIFRAHVAERMLPIFSTLPDGSKGGHNQTMMAKRNYCILDPVEEIPAETNGKPQYPGPEFGSNRDDSQEKHNRAITVVPDSVKMTLMVEKDNANNDATTVPYSMYIPSLTSH